MSAWRTGRCPFEPLPKMRGHGGAESQCFRIESAIEAPHLHAGGLEHLATHPPQAQAIPSILEGRNTLVAIPTASGKSLLAYMGMAKRLSEGHERSKAIYIVPLKALAMEKYEDLVELGNCMGWRVGLGIGDATSEAKNIDDCNILVCTSEKLDSLLRHKAELERCVLCGGR